MPKISEVTNLGIVHLFKYQYDIDKPSQSITITLFGAKDGGRHRQERAVVLTSLRRTETTLRLSYGFGGELTVY